MTTKEIIATLYILPLLAGFGHIYIYQTMKDMFLMPQSQDISDHLSGFRKKDCCVTAVLFLHRFIASLEPGIVDQSLASIMNHLR